MSQSDKRLLIMAEKWQNERLLQKTALPLFSNNVKINLLSKKGF